MATNFVDSGLGSLEECVNALRKCNLDENASMQMLLDAKKEMKICI